MLASFVYFFYVLIPILMQKFVRKFNEIVSNKSLMKKIWITLGILAIYRLLVFIPVPFIDISALVSGTFEASAAAGVGYMVMLLGGALDKFAIIAVGVSPYITASIVMQLLGSVVPKLEELTEQGEVGQNKINQYTRYLAFPLALVQGIGMVYIMNSMLGGQAIPDLTFGVVLLCSFVLSVGSILLMWLGELITEKGISNGISMIIFSSIVAGIVQQVYTNLTTGSSVWSVAIFMLVIVIGLILLSIFILKSVKEIPVVYARQGKVQQSSVLPIPMNPVGMVPVIFAMAFISFPYLISKLIMQFQPANQALMSIASWIEMHLNIFAQQPGWLAILFYVILIVAFTFFYALITFSPDRIADNIQKKGGFIPGIRPGKATAKYVNAVLMHLCLWGGLGLALIAIYTYVLNWLPFIGDAIQSMGGLPVVVTGTGIIIIVGVVQDVINKVQTDLVMQKYEQY